MVDSENLSKLYEEILNESNGSHGKQKDIEKLLDITREINKYLEDANKKDRSVKPYIARIERIGRTINYYPNNGEKDFLSFHQGGDFHPLRRYMRRLFNDDIELLKKYVDRKFFRQYVQPILTGS